MSREGVSCGSCGSSSGWYLKSSGTGEVTSSPTLPLSTTMPTQTPGAVNAGRVLQVRVAVTTASAGDVMLAYDTTTHPGSLLVG